MNARAITPLSPSNNSPLEQHQNAENSATGIQPSIALYALPMVDRTLSVVSKVSPLAKKTLCFFFITNSRELIGWFLICVVLKTDYRLMHQSAFAAIELWSSIRHPSIVPVREAFTTKSFNDNCAFFLLPNFLNINVRVSLLL